MNMPEETVAATGHLGGDQREQRIEKLEALRQAGIDAYPARSNVTHSASQVLEAFSSAEANAGAAPSTPAVVAVVTAGRLTSIRVMGKASFAHLVDGTGKVQIYLRQDEVGEESYDRF